MKTIWVITVDGWVFHEAFLTESAALAAVESLRSGKSDARAWDISIPDPE